MLFLDVPVDEVLGLLGRRFRVLVRYVRFEVTERALGQQFIAHNISLSLEELK